MACLLGQNNIQMQGRQSHTNAETLIRSRQEIF